MLISCDQIEEEILRIDNNKKFDRIYINYLLDKLKIYTLELMKVS